MKCIILIFVILTAAVLCLPACADHSVLPSGGELNETEALETLIAHLCKRLALRENEIRGHWLAFSTSQWISLVLITAGIVYTAFILKTRRKA